MGALVQALCPRCGADLKTDPKLELITCTYCGASFVKTPPRRVTEDLRRAGHPMVTVDGGNRTLVVALCVVGALAGGAAYAVALFAQRQTPPTVSVGAYVASKVSEGLKPSPSVLSPLAPPPKQPWRGRPGAPVVIEMFADFQCPFTQRAQSTIDEVLEKYEGKVLLVFRHLPLPFHPNAIRAAVAAEEARAQRGNDGFWLMAKLMFANHNELDPPGLGRLANQLQLRSEPLSRALRDNPYKAVFEADAAAASAAGINSTPAFLINGQKVIGAQPFDRFAASIEAALSAIPP
jgi:protein-disulfide isomerase/DNA-directed RNA polymerase subunit RPC12/RpoP